MKLLVAVFLAFVGSIAQAATRAREVPRSQKVAFEARLVSGGVPLEQWISVVSSTQPGVITYIWKDPAGGPVNLGAGFADIAALQVERRQRILQAEDTGLTPGQRLDALARIARISAILDSLD